MAKNLIISFVIGLVVIGVIAISIITGVKVKKRNIEFQNRLEARCKAIQELLRKEHMPLGNKDNMIVFGNVVNSTKSTELITELDSITDIPKMIKELPLNTEIHIKNDEYGKPLNGILVIIDKGNIE